MQGTRYKTGFGEFSRAAMDKGKRKNGRCGRGAFSFIEIMFAVIILGIGFIMIAALFPVAIQQTQATSQDVTATAYATSISQMLPQLVAGPHSSPAATASYLVATGKTSASQPPIYASFANPQAATYPGLFTGANANLWNEVSGSLINSSNARYGWVGFWSRDENAANTPDNYANVVAVITENQNPQATGYLATTDLVQPVGGGVTYPATLQGWPVEVAIQDSSVIGGKTTTDIVWVHDGAIAGSHDAMATGAYIVIAQDNCYNGAAYLAGITGHWNGKVYRVAARREDLDSSSPVTGGGWYAWELSPGQDFTPEQITSGGTLHNCVTLPYGNSATKFANAYVVGRQLTDPTAAWNATTNPFTGNNQAIAAYSFTIPVQ